MSIIRTCKKANRFAQIDRTALNDNGLTWQAKGLLAYMLSMPDDWSYYVTELQKHSKSGRDATASALNELIKAKYVHRRKQRIQGKFKGYEYLVFEEPTVNGFSVNGLSVNGNSENGLSVTTNTDSTNNNKTNNNSSSQTDSQKHLIDSLKAELAELKKQKSSAKKQNSFVPALTMVTAKSEIEKIYTPESLQDSFQQTVGRKIQLDLVKSGLESFILKYDFERYPIFDKSTLDTKLFNWLARQKPNLNHNTKPKGLKIGTKEYSEKIKQDAARINSQYNF